MKQLGIIYGNEKDESGLSRFFSMSPSELLDDSKDLFERYNWLKVYSINRFKSV